jgi:O-antigen ligase
MARVGTIPNSPNGANTTRAIRSTAEILDADSSTIGVRPLRPEKRVTIGPPSGPLFLNCLVIADAVLALALGGGSSQGLWADAFIQLCSLPLLGLIVVKLWREGLRSHDIYLLLLVNAVVFLPLLQLLPLPPPIWSSLPGRASLVESYKAAGIPLPWEPLSLDPDATWFSLLSLLPAIAVFLALNLLGLKTRRILSLLILGFAFGNVLLGLAQLAEGPESPLRLYAAAKTGDSVGLFASRNHYACLLAVAIPITAAWSVGSALQRNVQRGLSLSIFLITYVVLLLGIGMARSRAGLILAVIAALVSPALTWGLKAKGISRSRFAKLPLFFAGANLFGLILVFEFGFVGIANRLENDPILQDQRVPVAEMTAHAIAANLPLGIGFGAFGPVYQMFEVPALIIPAREIHAHDDWLEVILDGGLPAIALTLAFLIWYFYTTIQIWRAPSRTGSAIDRALARTGPVIVGLLLLHSTVDYPLRTTSLMVVFAFGAALMVPLEEEQLRSDASLRISSDKLPPVRRRRGGSGGESSCSICYGAIQQIHCMVSCLANKAHVMNISAVLGSFSRPG